MEKISNIPNFIIPNAEREAGEIARVAKEVFGIDGDDKIKRFGMHFLEVAKSSQLVDLTEDLWEKLENTDSYSISLNDWSLVEDHAVGGHPDHPRDWQFYKKRYEEAGPIEAPMVVKKGEMLHLVSGNTRLMVARALGIRPKVLLVEIESDI